MTISSRLLEKKELVAGHNSSSLEEMVAGLVAPFRDEGARLLKKVVWSWPPLHFPEEGGYLMNQKLCMVMAFLLATPCLFQEKGEDIYDHGHALFQTRGDAKCSK